MIGPALLDEAYPAPEPGTRFSGIHAQHPDRSGIGRQKTEQQFDEGGLAHPVGPQEEHDLTRPDHKIHSPEHRQASVGELDLLGHNHVHHALPQ